MKNRFDGFHEYIELKLGRKLTSIEKQEISIELEKLSKEEYPNGFGIFREKVINKVKSYITKFGVRNEHTAQFR